MFKQMGTHIKDAGKSATKDATLPRFSTSSRHNVLPLIKHITTNTTLYVQY